MYANTLYLQVDNQSTTPLQKRNAKDRSPIEPGVDGKVVIDPDLVFVMKKGTLEEGGDGTYISKNRESIVFHELAENLERTSEQFGKKNYDEAHSAANKRQDKFNPKDRRRDGESGEAGVSKKPHYNKSPNTKSKPQL
ncbi:MAG: hypothetical protein ACK504_09915 [Bacteroidota bacterium]